MEGHRRAVFYFPNGTVVRSYVDDPAPELVKLSLSIIPPGELQSQHFTMASGSVVCRRVRDDGDEVAYEPAGGSDAGLASAPAYIHMSEEAAKLLHHGQLSAARLVADVIGTKLP